MSDRSTRVCPVEEADRLDTRFRRWMQNPKRILKPYIEECRYPEFLTGESIIEDTEDESTLDK